MRGSARLYAASSSSAPATGHRAVRAASCVIAIGLGLSGAALAASAQSYDVTSLGVYDSGSSQAIDINDTGQVVVRGVLGTSFIWDDGTMLPLTAELGTRCTPAAINDDRTVAGHCVCTGCDCGGWCEQAVKWPSPDTIVGLGWVGEPSVSGGFDINGSGLIAGSSYSGAYPPTRPATFTTAASPLETTGTGVALAVNDAGDVVGRWADQAALWRGGGRTDLGKLDGDSTSTARDINSLGEIVGASVLGFNSRAFHWQSGVMSELQGLGGSSIALGINDDGVVVGVSCLSASSSCHAVKWENGSIVDLNDEVSTCPEWELLAAVAINNDGQIVGRGVIGGEERGFLLDPSEEESSGGCPYTPEIRLTTLNQALEEESVPEAMWIDAANNYTENIAIRIDAIVPAGEPNAGEVACCYDGIITLSETTGGTGGIRRAIPLAVWCPAPHTPTTNVNAGEPGIYDETGTMLLTRVPLTVPFIYDYTVELVAGSATVVAKSLSLSANPQGTPEAPGPLTLEAVSNDTVPGDNNPVTIPQWIDVTADGKTGVSSGGNGKYDWFERHFWDLYRARLTISGEPREMLESVLDITTDYGGPEPAFTDEDRIVRFNAVGTPSYRVPWRVSLSWPWACQGPYPPPQHSCKSFVNTVMHEARHTWVFDILHLTAQSCMSDDESDLIENPDNDDDPALVGDGDFLPEEPVINRVCTNGHYPSTVPPDASPVRDPDANSAGNETVEQTQCVVDELNECDAWDFGFDHENIAP